MYLDEMKSKYKQLILGNNIGIGLSKRGLNDPHVCFTVIMKDGERWFELNCEAISCYWLPNLLNIIEAAEQWCEMNCEPAIHENNQWGWNFKE